MSIIMFIKFTKTFVKVILTCIGILLAPGCLASAKDEISLKLVENYSNDELSHYIGTMFTQADQITIKYLPNINMGSSLTSKKDIDKQWKYMFSYRCPSSCEKNAKEIQTYLSSGKKLASDCPAPFYALLELYSSSNVISKIYIQQSGQCISLTEGAFYTDKSFSDFLNLSQLYPYLVK